MAIARRSSIVKIRRRRIAPGSSRFAVGQTAIQKNPVVFAPQLQRTKFAEGMGQAVARQRKFADQLGQLGRIDPIRVATPKIAAINARDFIADDSDQAAEQRQAPAD